MSYFINPVTKEKEFIFGQGGGDEVASKLETELLAQIPINQPTHHLSLYESDEEIGKIYDDLASFLIVK
jgi:ATP-binding protein involved in chromosome partitioning